MSIFNSKSDGNDPANFPRKTAVNAHGPYEGGPGYTGPKPDWADEIAERLARSRRFDSDTGNSDKERIASALRRAKADGLREAAVIVDDLSWQLPMFEDAAMNEATDDAACAVQEQAVAAIRAAADKLSPPHTPQEPT